MKDFKFLILFACINVAVISATRSGTNRANSNLQILQNRCLTHQNTANKDRTCVTEKKLKMQITTGVEGSPNGVFYCLTYERTSGQIYGYDTLVIELHPDYDLQYSGANVIDYEHPSFKLYDVRVTEEYKGRFAIYSNNTNFKIYQVTINNEPQSCMFGKNRNRKKWPEEKEPESEFDEAGSDTEIVHNTGRIKNVGSTPSTLTSSSSSSTSTTTAATTTTTTIKTSSSTLSSTHPPTTTSTTTAPPFIQKSPEYTTASNNKNENDDDDDDDDEKCGVPQKIIELKQFQMPSNPGEYPYAASIYHILDFDDLNGNSYYKCSGTIINKRTVLTSVNCLLDHNARLIDEDYLIVRVSQYLTDGKLPNSKAYDVEQVIPHDGFNYKLDNNIAGMRLKRSIEFDDFVQPACMPQPNMDLEDASVGKVAGFGKSNILTEGDYSISLDDENCKENPSGCKKFNGNNTSGNVGSSDVGCGLFMNDSNHWIIVGIISEIPHRLSNGYDVIFTNVIFYIDWINKLNNI